MLNIHHAPIHWAVSLLSLSSLVSPAWGQPGAGYALLAWSGLEIQTVSHVAVLPQPGFDAAETQRLVHTESSHPGVISTQLRLALEYVELSLQRVATGGPSDGPGGWWEPAYVGYKLASVAHHGVGLQIAKTTWGDPVLAWEFKTIDDARAHWRNGLEAVGKTRSAKPGALGLVSQELNSALALIQQVLAVLP